MAQYVTDQTDANAASTYGTRYVFATLNYQLSRPRADWTFSQRCVASVRAAALVVGDYYDFKELASPGIQIRVYGRSGTITRDARTRNTRDLTEPGRFVVTFGDTTSTAFLRGKRSCDGVRPARAFSCGSRGLRVRLSRDFAFYAMSLAVERSGQ